MNKYNQNNSNQPIHFSRAMFAQAESSRMTATPVHYTAFNAGDIIPIYCREVLPDETLSIDLDFVVRQTTLLTPTMGSMVVDFEAFFVPNRIVNQSWKAVEGENYNGSWTANHVSLATLKTTTGGSTQIPVGSVADYYGYPTQQPIPNSLLAQCHDLKFRGYVMIWNEFFRDQNYQPPIPMSTLNVYQGFMDDASQSVGLAGGNANLEFGTSTPADGSFGAGSVKNALYGSTSNAALSNALIPPASPMGRFRAISAPLKANKIHDYFTTVLPSSQKSVSPVFAPVSGTFSFAANVISGNSLHSMGSPVRFADALDYPTPSQSSLRFARGTGDVAGYSQTHGDFLAVTSTPTGVPVSPITYSNLQTEVNNVDIDGLSLSVNDIRMAAAFQQVYEILANGGSRYRELVASFFGISAEDPYSDIPQRLGRAIRELDLYQTAQTAASESGSTPQGNLAAFGYTSSNCSLFKDVKFLEHGYVHIFAIVRHRNIYSSALSRDNFRLNMLDFYMPQLANISEQPVYAREINPFCAHPNDAFGYQEAWAEYRYEQDTVSGYMRNGIDGSLSLWNYCDDFDSTLQIADASWLKSNSQQVLDRTLAVTSSNGPQFKGQFKFFVDKTLPMPTYSVPGMDII